MNNENGLPERLRHGPVPVEKQGIFHHHFQEVVSLSCPKLPGIHFSPGLKIKLPGIEYLILGCLLPIEERNQVPGPVGPSDRPGFALELSYQTSQEHRDVHQLSAAGI